MRRKKYLTTTLVLWLRRGSAVSAACAELEAGGASFDLTALTSRDFGAPEVENDGASLGFHLCSDVLAPPPACAGAGPGGAYALKADGGCVAFGESSKFAALNATNPALGVEVAYQGDDACGGASSWLTVQLVCWASAVDAVVNRATRDGPCAYEVLVRAADACPLECRRGDDGQVCSNFGKCASDGDLPPRCDCLGQADGDACDQRVVQDAAPRRDDQTTPRRQEPNLWLSAFAALFLMAAAYTIARRCLALRRARNDDLENFYLRYRSVALLDTDHDGLEMHGRSTFGGDDDDDENDSDDDDDERRAVFLRL